MPLSWPQDPIRTALDPGPLGQSVPDPDHRDAQPLGAQLLQRIRASAGDVGQAMLGADHGTVGGGVHVGVHQRVSKQ